MAPFLRITAVYWAAAIVLTGAAGGSAAASPFGGLAPFYGLVRHNLPAVLAVALCLVAANLYLRRQGFWADVALAFAGLGLFFSGFILLKTAMPAVSTFWADPPLAVIDRALHGGIDPWELTHRLAPWINPQVADLIYVELWICAAIFFPVLLAGFETDARRRRAYLTLYVIAWIAVGNVLALVFLSAGPVYYDALNGGTDFAGLARSIADSGIAGTKTGQIQTVLLDLYLAGENAKGPGISAFPSVHVSVATVLAFYLHDRFRHPAATTLGAAFLGTILFLSVWLGWHYAVDGYVSIAVIAAARHVLVRRGLVPRAGSAPACPEASVVTSHPAHSPQAIDPAPSSQ